MRVNATFLQSARLHPDATFPNPVAIPGGENGVANLPSPEAILMGMSGHALWIGEADDELGLARSWIRPTLERWRSTLLEYSAPLDAARRAALAPATPLLAMLATDRPSRWPLEETLALSAAWPLMPIVSIASALVDGRRRSGPPLPGIDEVPWYELPGRLETWLRAWETGRPGTLTAPSTIRRDERLLGITAEPQTGTRVAIVAPTEFDAEGLAAIVAMAGGSVTSASRGSPTLDESADVLLWDVGRSAAHAIPRLGILAANRPGLRIVVIEPFPRAEAARAAIEAGASAILGKPLAIEALAGLLHRFSIPADGLGAAGA